MKNSPFASQQDVEQVPSIVDEVVSSAGRPLDSESRAFLEPRFGHDFSQVRIHTDERAGDSARAVNALAYTVGRDVVFGPGQYTPATQTGKHLLAHELTHVVQQGREQPSTSEPFILGEPASIQEHEANKASGWVNSGLPGTVSIQSNTSQHTLRRYQAGEEGHGGIEQSALTKVGFKPQEARKVYFGNWLRDLSQLPAKALPLLNILTLGEFGREITQQDLGTYVPSEHLDNPEGGGKYEDPLLTDPNDQKAAWKEMSPEQQAAFLDEQAHIAEIQANVAKSGLPEYIEVGKYHARQKLAEAVSAGKTDAGMQAMGNGLHAVEDYFSHSNFVEVAIWNMYQEGSITAKHYNELVGSELGNDVAKLGGKDQLNPAQPGIITGTYAPGANDWVSRLEVICTETEHGELTTSFIKGSLLKAGITVEEIAKKAASTGSDFGGAFGGGVGGVVGGAIGSIGGAVGGAASGAAEGWREHSGWSALGHAITGFFGGAVSGAASGAEKGYDIGAGVGEKVGSATGGVVGGALGALAGLSLDAAVLALGSALLLALFPFIALALPATIAAARTGILEQLSVLETAKAAQNAQKKGLGPTHSEIAKDSPHHQLYPASKALAIFVDEEIGKAMINAWNEQEKANQAASSSQLATPAITDPVTVLVDKYVSHPSRNDWWKSILSGFFREK